MSNTVLITVLSWEERYILGLEKNINAFNPSLVILFKYLNPLTAEWKIGNYTKTQSLLQSNLIEVEIDSSKPSETWFIFLKAFSNHCKGKNILIDISTMTREAIWLSLYNCRLNGCKTDYIYYKPKGYSGEWISRDPGKPRFLYKMSGIAKLGAPSLLLITGGYDIQRLDSLIYNFEPKQTMLFFQNGEEPRNKENFNLSQELLRAKYNIGLMYEYDAYDTDSSFDLIVDKLKQRENGNSESYLESYNIILNSLGAKTSAITLFNIWLKHPHVALSYIPSKEYNKEYSFGIGDEYTGSITF